MIRRRLVLAVMAGMVAAPATAQRSTAVPRIGFLTGEPAALGLDPFKEGLRRLGYVEGRNISLEVRLLSGNPDPERFAKLAGDLVRLNVDVIVAGGSDSIRAAQHATKTIPIIMAQTSDAVGAGFVSSLARPGGNITGVSSLAGEIVAKRLQLAKQIVSGARRVAVLSNPANPSHAPGIQVLQRAAAPLALELHVVEARGPADLQRAFSAMTALRADALLVLPDTAFNPHTQTLQLAAQAKLPAIWWRREFVETGGLVSYGSDNPAMYRQAAEYVERILKGAKPAELPVEQPSKFEIYVNLRTAAALGLQIPPSLLVLADKVIQ